MSGPELKGIIKEGTLKSLVSRAKSEGIELKLRRSCYGKPALYDLDSFPPKYHDDIVAHLGDPRKKPKSSDLANRIRFDQDAMSYYNKIVLSNGNKLSEEVIRQYSNEASILQVIGEIKDDLDENRRKRGRKLIGFWPEALDAIHDKELKKLFPHKLPGNIRALERKYKKFRIEGYDGLISGKYANKNTLKITDEAGKWLIARWATPIVKLTITQLHEEFNSIAPSKGWSPIKKASSIRNYLYKPEIEAIWCGMRYGELYYKEKHLRQQRTMLPTLRDTLWYADGTKMNFFYRSEDGNRATCNVYEVMDAASEKFLGYHVSPTENFEAQYNAFKMAVKTSGCKPLELKYDNQGGHKKLQAGNFLTNIARLSLNTAPHNGKSKTIENAFGRFQAQVMHKLWYFTGQNITTKKQESKANMEFILANEKNLPTLQEAIAAYVLCRNEWNEGKHPNTGISRNLTYSTSENPKTTPLQLYEYIDLFWITTKDPSTYRASGLKIQVNNQEYAYEVFDKDGEPDQDFYRNNIGRKFYTKYEPDDMSMVRLYDTDSAGRLRFVSIAQPYKKVNRAKFDQFEGEASFIKQQELINKEVRVKQQEQIEDLMEQHGWHPSQHGLNMPSLKGVSKKDVERLRTKALKQTTSSDNYGKYTKATSNVVPADIENNTSEDFYDEF